MTSFILGSSSKRRVELLSSLKLDFIHHPTPFDEESFTWNNTPKEDVQELAKLKAAALVPLYPDFRLLTADTIVVLDNEILGKPKNKDQARLYLQKLNQRKHKVMTGVCIYFENKFYCGVDVTQVQFACLSEDQIEKYISSPIPYDKAGGYAIQGGIGSLLVQSIEGSYDTVMGLPLALVDRLMLKTGYNLWQHLVL